MTDLTASEVEEDRTKANVEVVAAEAVVQLMKGVAVVVKEAKEEKEEKDERVKACHN